ncbi:hypothetical protein FGADI_3655 [Fusarium gaditjirri]|uniref:Uncharacterized protein n=1 Tax=Fusarium gaditjirri TaxID=282569 RepID=A0A8H4TF68_9HYPO|nr:hypothetical protein FGADI_3655 [Fusarium gaditjirri]
MESNLLRSEVENDPYILTRHDFIHEISAGDSEWRSTQVDRVISSFEEAKKVMRAQAIHEIHKYLKSGRWIRDVLTASRHPAYKLIKGHSGSNRDGPTLYYPYFFVIQAIFEPSDAFRTICQDMSRYWGLEVDIYEPFYPRLQDTEREMELIMGKQPGPRRQVEPPSQNHYSPAVFTPNQDVDSEVEEPQGSIQVAPDAAHASYPVPASAADTLRGYDKEVASIRNEFEQRLVKLQAQIQQDATEP